MGQGRTDRFRENRDPRFLSYTPLTIPRGRVLNEALQAELILALKQSQTPRNVDSSKHYQYHRNYGHTTESCQALKDKIEELIQAGHFRRFIKTDTTTHRSPQRNRYLPRGQFERPGCGDSRFRDDNQRLPRQRRSETPVRRTRPRCESPERAIEPDVESKKSSTLLPTRCHSVSLNEK